MPPFEGPRHTAQGTSKRQGTIPIAIGTKAKKGTSDEG